MQFVRKVGKNALVLGGRKKSGRCDDSDAAKALLSSGQRSSAQAQALPNSNDPRVCSRAATTARGDPGAHCT